MGAGCREVQCVSLWLNFVVFLRMLKQLYLAVVCCLKLQGNLSLAELIRDGLI